jgi:precorrin-6B methylase 2
MSKSSYIFDETQHDHELERLRVLEGVFDAPTQRCLLATGLGPGWRCVEVGAGAGSIAKWMSDTVGPHGNVLAVDVNTRFLSQLSAPNLEVRESDIRMASVEPESVDMAHVRFVLIHVREWREALATVVASVKPGGWLVLEEPDFSCARALSGPMDLHRAFNNVHNAIETMFAARGLDHAFGARLPRLLQEHQLETIRIENDAPIVAGGSPQSRMMAMSARLLAKAYIATGFAKPEDISRYDSFANDASCWATYQATIRAIARKPLVAGTARLADG